MVRVTDILSGYLNTDACERVDSITYSEFTKKHIPKREEILFSRVGSYGNSCFIKHDQTFCLGQNTVCIAPNAQNIEPFFLYLALNSRYVKHQIESFVTGASQPTISLGSINKLSIPVPPLPTQHKIASILSAYDDLIENNTRRIKILEEMAQAIYREWFVRFRFPGHENAPMVDSELGQIPQGWEVRRLGDLSDIRWGDTSVTKKSYSDQGYSAYSASGLDGKLPYFDYERPGIILSAIGANCGLTWFENGKWSCIKNTIRYWANNKRVTTEYLYYATARPDSWPKRGAAQPFISLGDARKIELLVPHTNLMNEFTNLSDGYLSSIATLKSKNQNLRKTRDLLLPRLISGRLDVEELDIAV
jgi:type I restriction enzyme S subunit